MKTRRRRFDTTLRIVMWLDAVLSVAIVATALVAGPIAATVGVASRLRLVLAGVVLVWAVLLAAFGAVTAVLLMCRMAAGELLLPVRLWLPLPDPLRPPEYRRASSVSAAAEPRAGVRGGR